MTAEATTTRSLSPFVLLSAGTLAAGISNGITMVALPWLVLERTGSATAAAVVAAAASVPLLFASLLSGTIVDRVGRRRVSMLSDALSAASVLAIPLLDQAGGLTVAMLAVLAALGATFDPAGITARETMLPAAARQGELRLDRANSIFEAIYNGAYLIGPGISGLLLATIGAVNTLWFAGIGFAVSIVAIGIARIDEAPAATTDRPVTGFWRDTAEGLRFVWDQRLIRTTTLFLVGLIAFYLPIEGVLLPAWFTAQGKPAHLGWVLMAMSVGGLAGTLAYGQWGHRLPRRTVFVGALIVSSAAVVGLATLPGLPAMLVLCGLLGLAYGPVNPIVNVVIQTRTPERLRGRVTGVVTSTSYAAGPAGYLLAGPLIDGIGIRPAFLLLAGLLLLAMLPALVLRVFRELNDLDGGVGTVDHPASVNRQPDPIDVGPRLGAAVAAQDVR